MWKQISLMPAVSVVCAWTLIASWGPPVHATPGSQQERIADGLHQKALEHFREGRYEVAVQNWEAAEALHRHWKYAFNMALALQADEQWLRAWEACRRTRDYGLPERNLPTLNQLVEVVEGELLSDHAYIALEVTPPNANVIRNGGLWPAPRALWTRDGLSDLVVSHGVHGVKQKAWKHPPGQRHTLTVSLLPEPAPAPVVQQEQAPPPPSSGGTQEAQPDQKAVSQAVSETNGDEGSSSSADTAAPERTISAGVSTTEGTVASSASPTEGPPILGWASLGLGGAGLVAALVALQRHAAMADELVALNKNPPTDSFETYMATYTSKSDKASQLQTMGFVGATGGTILVTLGAYLLLTEDRGSGGASDTNAALAPIPLPGGMGLTLGGRF